MAEALGEAPSTVGSWKAVGRIPATKQPAVLDAAKRLGLAVTAEDVVFPMGGIDRAEWPIAATGNGDEFSGEAVTA